LAPAMMIFSNDCIVSLFCILSLHSTNSLAPISEKPQSLFSRRSLLNTLPTILIVPSVVVSSNPVFAAEDPRKIIPLVLRAKGDRLGVILRTTTIGNRSVVVVQGVMNEKLIGRIQVGMIVLNYNTAPELIERIENGPYPIELEFLNLAAGGDAFDDLGTTMVTPQDALELNQKLAKIPIDESSNKQFSISTVSKPTSMCAIQSRKGDVLEIVYEAYYYNNNDEKILYDASKARGTGQPYQTVLGSGDMISGVDQGLYDMCPGEQRLLRIPSMLAGYGQRALNAFRIPIDYNGLEWKIKLVSIEGVIRETNNDKTRDEREGRVAYTN